MITNIKQFKETIFIPRNIEERKIKFRKENLRMLQQEILTVNTEDGWLELDDLWKDINPKYVKTKQINGNVKLRFNEDGCIPEWLENITINGSFYCYGIGLTSLKGCPKIIKDSFDCSYNLLTSLEYGPIDVGRYYWCNHNKLSSLKGCPKIIKGIFDCSNNLLTSLEYGPIEVDGDYSCHNNKIKFSEEYVKSICTVKNEIIV